VHTKTAHMRFIGRSEVADCLRRVSMVGPSSDIPNLFLRAFYIVGWSGLQGCVETREGVSSLLLLMSVLARYVSRLGPRFLRARPLIL
jgi:hypothetical protein